LEAALLENRVVQAFEEGRVATGIYSSSASPKVIELLAFAGLDHVRIDLEGSYPNPETIRHLIHTAHAVGITPFVRMPEPLDVQYMDQILNMGALGIQIPRIRDRTHAEEIVQLVKGPPLGHRKIRSDNILAQYGDVDAPSLTEWVNRNVVVAVQVETQQAVEVVDEIAAVPGLDMLISGRNDLSISYGVPGQQFDPVVVEAEGRMIAEGKKHGKITSVTYFPLRGGDQIERLRSRIDDGVACVTFGSDNDLMHAYRGVMSDLGL
jgi:2-keto-3-deoxy-L-rhamnonate aldolase RhmA